MARGGARQVEPPPAGPGGLLLANKRSSRASRANLFGLIRPARPAHTRANDTELAGRQATLNFAAAAAS